MLAEPAYAEYQRRTVEKRDWRNAMLATNTELDIDEDRDPRPSATSGAEYFDGSKSCKFEGDAAPGDNGYWSGHPTGEDELACLE